MTSSNKEEAKYLSLLSHLIESCAKSNYKDLTFLSNEETFKELLIEIEPKLQETGGLIEITQDASFGVRYGNFVSIFKVLEEYLLKHSNRDTFTTVNLQSLIVINELLQNDSQQLILFAEVLLFLASISSQKDFFIDKVSELDEAIVSFFFLSIEKYLFIDSDNHNATMSKSLLDKSVNAHKKYEKEKKNYINIIKDYEMRMIKMRETIEGLEKAKQIIETKLNDQIRENQMMNRNQNKAESIHEQLITNTLTNNDLMNKLLCKDLEIEELKKEMELNNKHSLARTTKLEEQLEIQNEKINQAKEVRSQFEKLQSKYKEFKLSKDSKSVSNEEIFKALEQRNIQMEMYQKEKGALMNQIEKLNKELLTEKEMRKQTEFEKKKMEFEISDLQSEVNTHANNQQQQHQINSSFLANNNKDQMELGISMDGILNETSDNKQLYDSIKMIQTPSNTMQILALHEEVLKLKEENSQLQLKIEDAKAKNKSLSKNREKMDIQMQKYELEIQKQTLMIDRIKNEANRFEDDNKCLNEKIKDMIKNKKNEIEGMKKDITSKTALIETMLSEKKGMVFDFQKLQKEYESYKQSISHSPTGPFDKKASKGTVLQQQHQSSQVVISNSEILSLRNEIQNLKLSAIQKDNQIQLLKEESTNDISEEEINTKLADLDFYKKSYEEQKTRVNKEHELISDSLHKLAIHFMGLKDNLQKKMIMKNK